MELRSSSGLLALERFYHGEKLQDVRNVGKSQQPGWNLLSIARENGVRLKQPKGQVVVAALGDALSGKSSFLNALTEELVFPQRKNKAFVLQWAVSEEVQKGEWPGLLSRVVEEFPTWEPKAFTTQLCRVTGNRLKGLQLVEVPSPSDLVEQDVEVIQCLLRQVDIVVCLLDSQAKQPASDELVALLTKLLAAEEAPAIHFLLSKADLVIRESDRIRLIAKASRMLQDRLGGGRRGFEILPASTGDLNVLLDILEIDGTAADGMDGDGGDSLSLEKDSPKWDAGRMRTWRLAQDLIGERMKEGLKDLMLDLEALKAAVAAQRQDPQAASNHLIWFGAALGIVTAVVPFVLDEEQDSSLVPIFMMATMALACVCLLLAFCLSQGTSKPPEGIVDLVMEQEQFLSLVEKQLEAWRTGHSFSANGEGEIHRKPLEIEARTDSSRKNA